MGRVKKEISEKSETKCFKNLKFQIFKITNRSEISKEVITEYLSGIAEYPPERLVGLKFTDQPTEARLFNSNSADDQFLISAVTRILEKSKPKKYKDWYQLIDIELEFKFTE